MNSIIYTNIDNGINLLTKSCDLYNEGKFLEAYKIYEEAGKYLKEATDYVQTEKGKKSIIYGDNRNFGIIYKIFEANTVNLLKTKDGRKKLKNIISTIHNNKILNEQFNIYNTFTNPKNIENTVDYVSEAIDLIQPQSKKEIISANDELIDLFREYKLNENIDLSPNEIDLYESIEYLIFNSKSLKNITDYSKVQKCLCEHVEKIKKNTTETNIDSIYEEKIDNIVNTHEKTLTDDEIELIQSLSNKEEAPKIYEKYKKDTINLINTQINEDVNNKDQWCDILEKIQKKNYSDKTALVDISEFIETINELTK